MAEYLHDDETRVPVPTSRIHLYKKPTQPGAYKKCTTCKRTLSKDMFYKRQRKTGIFCVARCKDCYSLDAFRRRIKKTTLTFGEVKAVNYNTDLGVEQVS